MNRCSCYAYLHIFSSYLENECKKDRYVSDNSENFDK